MNSGFIKSLLKQGLTPVISPIAISEESEFLNVDGDRAAALIARGKSPHMTPGRVLFKPLEFIAGPEDRAYDFLTGLVDLGLNLLDPTFWAGKAVKTVSFEVIIGSFSDESNAKKLIKNLSKKSFKARQLAFVKKLFRVSAGKFSNKENAIEYQNTIKKKFKISSWILIN